MKTRLTNLTAFRKLAEQGLILIATRDPESRKRFQELQNFHAFLEKEIPALIDRYDRERK